MVEKYGKKEVSKEGIFVMIEEIINFLFPGRGLCLLCWQGYSGTPQRGACPRCCQELLDLSSRNATCPLCGRYTTDQTCPNCHGQGIAGISGIYSVVPYAGQYRELIQQLKYNGDQELSKPLGYLMSSRWQQAHPNFKPDLIVPVPLEPQRHLERGFNQSTLLGLVVSKSLRIPLEEDYLLRGEGRASQTTLGRQARSANTRDAFRAGTAGKLKGKTVLLVDDIVTTGSTLAACAAVLRDLEAESIWGITWAAGIRG